eukprot:scaffold107127_cov39-Phaeocystis_antarctica.AAC.1
MLRRAPVPATLAAAAATESQLTGTEPAAATATAPTADVAAGAAVRVHGRHAANPGVAELRVDDKILAREGRLLFATYEGT